MMNQPMNISVGICTYNSEKYLPEQLDSILHQTVPVSEIVVVDDTSTDGTLQLVQDYADRYPGIFRIFRNEKNQGARKNFEKVLSESRGDVIFLSDHDDSWLPQKVEQVIHYFNTHPTDQVVFTNAVFMDEDSKPLASTLWDVVGFTAEARAFARTKDELLSYLLKHERTVTGATLALKKEILPQVLPFRLMAKIWHDAWIAFVAANAKVLGYIEEPLIRYRVHSRQQVGWVYMQMIESIMAGNNPIPELKRKELKREINEEDLVNLLRIRRRRVKLTKRLARYIKIDPVIYAEIMEECKASEKAFGRAKSLPVRIWDFIDKRFK